MGIILDYLCVTGLALLSYKVSPVYDGMSVFANPLQLRLLEISD